MKFGQEKMQLYQYRCNSCGTVLKETQSPIDTAFLRSLNERCPGCGGDLQEQTIDVKRRANQSPSLSPKPYFLLPTIKRAYDIRPAWLTFDIPQIDSLLDLADKGAICVTSSGRDGGWLANTLVTRLCTRALMSTRQGGFESPSIIFIDAGNCSDVYQCSNFARQYGLDIDKVLDSIIVSRPFTIHQLAGLIIREIESIVKRTRAKLVIISDLLAMFVKDPQIDPGEARWLVKEMTRSLRKAASQAFLVVSLHSFSAEHPKLLSIFDTRIEIAKLGYHSQANDLEIEVSNTRHSSKNRFSISEMALQTVQLR